MVAHFVTNVNRGIVVQYYLRDQTAFCFVRSFFKIVTGTYGRENLIATKIGEPAVTPVHAASLVPPFPKTYVGSVIPSSASRKKKPTTTPTTPLSANFGPLHRWASKSRILGFRGGVQYKKVHTQLNKKWTPLSPPHAHHGPLLLRPCLLSLHSSHAFISKLGPWE